MPDERTLTAGALESLVRVAAVPLSRERQAALLEPLGGLIDAANALSARMAASDRGIAPMLRFPDR